MAATAALTEFQEEDFALEAANSYLSDPSCTPAAQFQATRVLQYNSLKNWVRLSTAQKLQLRETLYSLMNNSISSNCSMQSFALNKVMQVYVLFWKRDWKDVVSSGTGAHGAIFDHVTHMLQAPPPQQPEGFRHGCMLLRVLVEEFSSRSSAEAGLPMNFHLQAHEAFENVGLDQSLQLVMQCLSAAFQMSDPRHAIPCITEAVKLFSEVLSWEFGGGTLSLSHSSFARSKPQTQVTAAGSQLLTLPRRWSGALIQSSLVDSVGDVYSKTRQLLELCVQNSQAAPVPIPAVLQSLGELRGMMVNLASLSGQILENDAERCAYGGAVLAKTLTLLDTAVASSLDQNLVDDFRAQECENLGTVLLRLLANYRLSLCCQMPGFDAMMLSLGRATFELSKELAMLAEQQLGRQLGHALASTPAGHAASTVVVLDGELSLLEGWRGGAISLFLDVWCMVLDDPLMLRGAFSEDSPSSSSSPSEAAAAQVSTQLKLGLRGLAAEVFKQLFESVWRITICEALVEPDEEEGEEVEAIAVRNLDDLLGSICTVGRTNFALSLEHVRQTVSNSLDEIERLVALPAGSVLPPRDTLRLQESLRISVLFASHLCDDAFRGNSREKSSEVPLIPGFILDSCLYAPADTTSVLVNSLSQMSRLLQQQVLLGPAHPLFSPLLLQVAARFFTEYFTRFVDPDAELYSASTAQLLPHLFGLHASGSGPAGGDALAGLVEQLAAAIYRLISAVPLEGDLVQALAELLTAMSKSGAQRGAAVRRAMLLASPSVAEIFKVVTAHDCRLSLDGIMLLFNSLGGLAVRAGSEATVLQLCSYVHTKGSSMPALLPSSGAGAPPPELKLSAQQFVACLRGLATCPRGQDRVLYGLFDACLPIVAWIITHAGMGGEDDLTKAILLLLRDLAFNKLSGMSHQSSSGLYQTSMTVLQTFSLRLGSTPAAAAVGGTVAAAAEEVSFRSDVLLHVLELLNHLSSKDFVFDDDEDVAAGGDAERGYAFHMTVSQVLMFGFEMVVQLVNAEVLTHYPAAADRYFSFAAFIASTYGEDLGARVQERGEQHARALLNTLMQHLLWAAGAIDATAARLSFQAVQSLAAYQANSMSKQDQGLGMAVAADVFPAALDRLLEMVLFPATCEYGIAWDRVDSWAHTLIHLIVLDPQR